MSRTLFQPARMRQRTPRKRTASPLPTASIPRGLERYVGECLSLKYDRGLAGSDPRRFSAALPQGKWLTDGRSYPFGLSHGSPSPSLRKTLSRRGGVVKRMGRPRMLRGCPTEGYVNRTVILQRRPPRAACSSAREAMLAKV